MHFYVCTQCSHQHVTADIAAIFSVTLREHRGTDEVSCVAVTP
jgi:hypothetical protein